MTVLLKTNSTRGVLRTPPNFLAKIANGFNYFRKKLHLRTLTSSSYASGVKHRPSLTGVLQKWCSITLVKTLENTNERVHFAVKLHAVDLQLY